MVAIGVTGNVFAQSLDDDIVILYTPQGELVIEFFPEDAPNHVANFVGLAQDGYYDNTLFHRIISGFMIQGGDPNTRPGGPQDLWGTGGPDEMLVAEFNDIMHSRGIVSMARSANPDSAGSQFFIVHQNSNFLDTQYTVFGRLVTDDSYRTLDTIAATSTDAQDRPLFPESVRITTTEVMTRAQATAAGMELLDQSPPVRTTFVDEEPSTIDGTLEIPELNFSVKFPTGWVVQRLSGPGLPNAVAVAPQIGALPSSIAIHAIPADGSTLDAIVESKLADLEVLTDAGPFQIILQEMTEVNNTPAFVLEATNLFDTDMGTVSIKHREVTMIAEDMIYTFLLTSEMEFFDTDAAMLEESLQSFQILNRTEEATPEDPISNLGGGCLIATAAFGTEMAPQVQQLREIRDMSLSQTKVGADFLNGFNSIYYTFSPTIADYERENPLFREVVRVSITPMLSALSVLNYANMDTEVTALTYGVLTIVLILVSYMGSPALALFILRDMFRKRTKRNEECAQSA